MSLDNENIKNEEQQTDNTIAPDAAENTPTVEEAPTKKKPSSFSIGFVEQVELIVIAFVAIVLLFSFVFRTCRVSGPSMENTLLDSETVITTNMFYTPERNDIIVFHQTGTDEGDLNEPVVKRVIGLPGDTVTIQHLSDTMIVTVIDENGNKTVLEEPYMKYEGMRYWMYDNTFYVEEGTVFVMGDNRSNSMDSRDARIGLVDTRRILGKVIFRVTPFSRIGTVD